MIAQKINKEEFFAVKSEITDEGICISLKGKKYKVSYPKEVWKDYPDTNKEVLLDNLTFMQTSHLPAANNKKGAVYSTALPLFETFSFKATMFDIPSTAVIDKQKTTEYMKRYFNSNFVFSSYDTVMPKNRRRKASTKKNPSAIILFTAGKESLLTLAMCLEMGIKPIPIYINEEPENPESKHKANIIQTLEREYGLKVHQIVSEPGKLRWEEQQSDISNWGAGPQFLSYTLEIMPFAEYYDADYIFFGNEYSCDEYSACDEGFKANFCFDQNSEWTRQLDIVAKTMTNGAVDVGSIVGPLYELGLLHILHTRYPMLARLQMSCFTDNEFGKERKWCGNCSKCARLFAFFKALGISTEKAGFVNNMFDKESKKHFGLFGGNDLYSYDVSGLGSEEQAMAFYMAIERGEKGDILEDFKQVPIYNEIKANYRKLHKKYFSQYENIAMPYELKEKVLDIFDETFEGSFTPKDFRLKAIVDAERVEESTEVIQQPKQQ